MDLVTTVLAALALMGTVGVTEATKRTTTEAIDFLKRKLVERGQRPSADLIGSMQLLPPGSPAVKLVGEELAKLPLPADPELQDALQRLRDAVPDLERWRIEVERNYGSIGNHNTNTFHQNFGASGAGD